jgi:hypothetical protein
MTTQLGNAQTKNKGGIKAWATPEQVAYLESKRPAYIQVQSGVSGTFRAFWAVAYDEWFKRWPVALPSDYVLPSEVDPGDETQANLARARALKEEVLEKRGVSQFVPLTDRSKHTDSPILTSN